MPVGTLFPSVNPAQQTMAGYSTDVQVNNPDPVAQRLPATGGTTSGLGLLWLALALLSSGMVLRLGLRRA